MGNAGHCGGGLRRFGSQLGAARSAVCRRRGIAGGDRRDLDG